MAQTTERITRHLNGHAAEEARANPGAADDAAVHVDDPVVHGLGDPHWYLHRPAHREDLAPVPMALRLARDRDALLDELATYTDEQELLAAVDAINARIRYANSHAIEGPPCAVMPLDLEVVLERWEALRA